MRIAASLFQNLLLAQGLAVVFLTPALVAGAIAQEYQRRTLHELLASELTSAEIVLGKLAARLSCVAVLAATGLPLLLATGLLGGVELSLVLGSLAATLSTALFLGSLSILASTQTRSVRGAMNFTFTLVLVLADPARRDRRPLAPRRRDSAVPCTSGLGPVNAWVAATSPFSLWIDVMRGAIGGAPALLSRVVWMIALQTIYGALASALAVACLRPSFRARLGQVEVEAGSGQPDARKRRGFSCLRGLAAASSLRGRSDDLEGADAPHFRLLTSVRRGGRLDSGRAARRGRRRPWPRPLSASFFSEGYGDRSRRLGPRDVS